MYVGSQLFMVSNTPISISIPKAGKSPNGNLLSKLAIFSDKIVDNCSLIIGYLVLMTNEGGHTGLATIGDIGKCQICEIPQTDNKRQLHVWGVGIKWFLLCNCYSLSFFQTVDQHKNTIE